MVCKTAKIVRDGSSCRNFFVLISEHLSRNKSVPAVRESGRTRSGAKWNEHTGQCRHYDTYPYPPPTVSAAIAAAAGVIARLSQRPPQPVRA